MNRLETALVHIEVVAVAADFVLECAACVPVLLGEDIVPNNAAAIAHSEKRRCLDDKRVAENLRTGFLAGFEILLSPLPSRHHCFGDATWVCRVGVNVPGVKLHHIRSDEVHAEMVSREGIFSVRTNDLVNRALLVVAMKASVVLVLKHVTFHICGSCPDREVSISCGINENLCSECGETQLVGNDDGIHRVVRTFFDCGDP